MRTLSVVLLCGVGLAQAAPALIEDTLAQRLQACTACHGRDGRAAPDGYHPRIAGKPADYLYRQLLNFRDARRHYGPMVALVTPLPDAYLLDMARHFAALELPYAAPAAPRESAAVLERGRRLALEGDAARGVPACSDCHGKGLMGVLPATPALLGLPQDYLAAQLGAWVSGQRRAHAPDCMAQVARKLQGGDIVAVSAWLSSQAVPPSARAASAAASPPPLRCGSVEAVAP